MRAYSFGAIHPSTRDSSSANRTHPGEQGRPLFWNLHLRAKFTCLYSAQFAVVVYLKASCTTLNFAGERVCGVAGGRVKSIQQMPLSIFPPELAAKLCRYEAEAGRYIRYGDYCGFLYISTIRVRDTERVQQE